MSLVIGLTGGIACGKTTVMRAFMARGIACVDADDVARDIVAPGTPVLAQLVARYGPELLCEQGALNRARLRQIIFETPAERAWVEALMHPAIRARLVASLAEGTSVYRILSAPLLFETGLDRLVDRILVIDVPEPIQRERLRRRDGSHEAQIDAILNAQIDRDTRLSRADDIFDNTLPLDTLDARVGVLDQRYRALAAMATQGKSHDA